MSQPHQNNSNDITTDAEESAGETEVDTDFNGTTTRLKALKLESELWPDESELADEDVGVDPYNTGRFRTR